MDSSIEVDRGTAKAVQGMEGFRTSQDPRAARSGPGERQPQRTAAAAAGMDRLSVDPMRSTDRYRLVLPIDDRM
ncbi:MAG: hypothetical protein H6835_10325 [Planctomycetes bacterium]|nr:hypothetical protein [Planctomycetota bacterium]